MSINVEPYFNRKVLVLNKNTPAREVEAFAKIPVREVLP